MVDPELQSEIRDFLAGKRIAIVGLSHNSADFSCSILAKLQGAGFEVYGVNPQLGADPANRRYPDLASIPGKDRKPCQPPP